ncbi:ABC transporter permease [Planomonospora parontospora subsp. parontospora]|uniref:ABC transporter permease n=2 Tax=Planomonospora parontospora TaxID=58119 RepID=A0AA37BNS3_9ACTN|nr:FtsX-like permease family protein [Planomonospora parontospora]GGK97853.1 ABC transporter permease [Planomonospora parontospora]GII12833.1 ABC transporter permease [Planomonospora parontospora subsp. parontospora]
MLGIALSSLRHRGSAFMAAFVAMFLGAAVVSACGGLMETGIRLAIPPDRLAAASVVVTGDQSYEIPQAAPAAKSAGGEEDEEEEEESEWVTLPERVRLDAGVTDKIAAVPGVARAIGDVSFPAAVADGLRATGHGWGSAELTPYTVSSGTPPTRPGDVVLDAGLAAEASVGTGDQVRISAGGTTGTYRVSGLVTPPGDREVAEAPVFFLSADVQNLTGRGGKVDAVGILAAAGVDAEELGARVRTALAGQGAVVLTGDERGRAEFLESAVGSESLITLAGVFGGLLIIVVIFVVASTLGLSVHQRQREMALLRAIGTTPGQVRRLVLGEAMVMAVFAAALGSVLGPYLGGWLFDRLAGAGMVPEKVVFHQGWIPALIAVSVSLVTSFAAALVAARRAALAKPTEALADAALEPVKIGWFRPVLAVICFAGGIALAMVTMLVMEGPQAAATAGPAVLLWAIALALLSPVITKGMVAVLSGPFRRISAPSGELAVTNARTRIVRVAAAVTPIMLATGVATANLYVQTTQVAAGERAFVESLRADAVVTSPSGGLAPGLLDRVRAVPGVTAASEFVTSTGFVESPYDAGTPEDGWQLRGATAEGAAQTMAMTVASGAITDLRGDTVALTAEHARRLSRKVGDTITMRLGDRSRVDLRIVALLSAGPGAETVVLPARLLAAHTTAGLPTQILVRTTPDADLDRLSEAIGGLGAQVSGRDALIAAHGEQEQTQAWVNYLLVGMIIVYTAISVVNTQVMTTTQRRREFGLQRLTGATPRQVMEMTGVEAALVAVIGIVLGTFASLVSLVPFSIAVSGTPVPSGPVWIYLVVVLIATVLTLGATWLPTWLAMRVRPAEAAVAAY